MIRNSKQREIILDIVNNSYNHPSAYDIYKLCREKIPNISLGTVYRNLNNLASDGIIKKIIIDDDTCKFDHIDKRHSHFICIKCGCIIDVFEDYFTNVKDIDGNIVNDYDIYFKGICNECQKEGMIKDGIKRK